MKKSSIHRKIRKLDKSVDELAEGRTREKYMNQFHAHINDYEQDVNSAPRGASRPANIVLLPRHPSRL
ncbi:MAG: hypothetical protein ACFHX7_08275 [Pseudomonadota bacterium]